MTESLTTTAAPARAAAKVIVIIAYTLDTTMIYDDLPGDDFYLCPALGQPGTFHEQLRLISIPRRLDREIRRTEALLTLLVLAGRHRHRRRDLVAALDALLVREAI